MFVPTIPGWTRAVKEIIIRVIMTQEILKENNLEINSTWMNKYHFINFMATLHTVSVLAVSKQFFRNQHNKSNTK